MLKNLQRILLHLTLIAVLSVPLAACNTMEGLGRDAKAAGEAVTGAASKSKARTELIVLITPCVSTSSQSRQVTDDYRQQMQLLRPAQ